MLSALHQSDSSSTSWHASLAGALDLQQLQTLFVHGHALATSPKGPPLLVHVHVHLRMLPSFAAADTVPDLAAASCASC